MYTDGGADQERAMGIDYIDGEIAERLSQSARFKALEELNIANSRKILPVKDEPTKDWAIEVVFNDDQSESEEE